MLKLIAETDERTTERNAKQSRAKQFSALVLIDRSIWLQLPTSTVACNRSSGSDRSIGWLFFLVFFLGNIWFGSRILRLGDLKLKLSQPASQNGSHIRTEPSWTVRSILSPSSPLRLFPAIISDSRMDEWMDGRTGSQLSSFFSFFLSVQNQLNSDF